MTLVTEEEGWYQSIMEEREKLRRKEFKHFAKLEQKYQYVVEHMDYCRQAALSDEFPAHTTWLHPPTLARWLYSSIVEFAKEYHFALRELGRVPPKQNLQTIEQISDIDKRVRQSKQDILEKYPELKEVLHT